MYGFALNSSGSVRWFSQDLSKAPYIIPVSCKYGVHASLYGTISQVAFMKTSTFCRAFSYSGLYVKLAMLCEIESEQHGRMLTMFLSNSKFTWQWTVLCFREMWCKIKNISFKYMNIFKT